MRWFGRTCLLAVELLGLSGCQNRSLDTSMKDSGTVQQPNAEPVLNATRGMQIYTDNFDRMSGYKTVYQQGNWQIDPVLATRIIYPFADRNSPGIVTQIIEDAEAIGPDNKPGVLSLTWLELPNPFNYSGFAYLGMRDSMLKLPELRPAKTPEDFRGVLLAFKYKGINAAREELHFQLNCRMEVDVPDSYQSRLDLRRLNVSSDWQIYEMDLGDGGNFAKFLEALQSAPNSAMKLNWSQIGSRHGLLPGDTVLIDDIVIYTTKQLPKIHDNGQTSDLFQ